MEELEAEHSFMPVYAVPENVETEKKYLKSHTDPECGYIHQEKKKGLGYLTEMTVDTKNGIIIGVDCLISTITRLNILLLLLDSNSILISESHNSSITKFGGIFVRLS